MVVRAGDAYPSQVADSRDTELSLLPELFVELVVVERNLAWEPNTPWKRMTRPRDLRERVRHRADPAATATDRRLLLPPWRRWPGRSSTRCWPAYGS